MKTLFCFCVSVLLLALTTYKVCAAEQHLFKIASLAPAGSVWVEQFQRFADEVKEKSGGEVTFRVYAGGVMGDEQAMYRKMRVGQLHGGGFTMSGISSVVQDFRVLSIPFLMKDYKEVDCVKNGLLPTFKDEFREKGLELIAMTEVGFIYAMSTKPLRTLDDLRKSTNWSPAGDPVSETYLTTLGITPVQLSIPDVLSSLQSGLVETVYNSLYGGIVFQWFTKAKYVVDIPYGYAYGVFALDGKKFAKLTPEQQQIIRQSADTHFPILLQKTRESNEESKKIMIERGSEFVSVDAKTAGELRAQRDRTIDKLVESSFSKNIYNQTVELLKKCQADGGSHN
jgi:TRAP-type C4-dicarboxylate transport system substrate-binding protein